MHDVVSASRGAMKKVQAIIAVENDHRRIIILTFQIADGAGALAPGQVLWIVTGPCQANRALLELRGPPRAEGDPEPAPIISHTCRTGHAVAVVTLFRCPPGHHHAVERPCCQVRAAPEIQIGVVCIRMVRIAQRHHIGNQIELLLLRMPSDSVLTDARFAHWRADRQGNVKQLCTVVPQMGPGATRYVESLGGFVALYRWLSRP